MFEEFQVQLPGWNIYYHDGYRWHWSHDRAGPLSTVAEYSHSTSFLLLEALKLWEK